MEFQKYHGLGNDFIILNSLNTIINLNTEQTIQLCHRNFGIGADGIIIVSKSNTADFKMTIINSDGSIAKMCGNGIRCLSKYLVDNKLFFNNKISIETDAGIKICTIIDENIVEVDMGEGLFEDNLLFEGIHINEKIDEFNFTSVSVGNPHLVLSGKYFTKDDAVFFGKKYTNIDIYKDGTNVEFVNILNNTEIQLFVYERGCGLTMACGTGACAAVSALIKNNKFKFNEYIKVNLPGGYLFVKVLDNFSNILMKGDVKYVFKGDVIV